MIHSKSYNFFCSLIFTCCLCFISLQLEAQKEREKTWYLGAKAGYNQSTMIFDDVFFNPRMRMVMLPGIHSGLIFKYFEQDYAGIQLELNFEQKGWGQEFATGDLWFSRLSFIEIPAMMHINFSKGKNRVLFNLGPFLEYLLHISDDGPVTLPEESIESFFRIDPDQVNRFNYGGRGSVGFLRNFGFGTIQLEGGASFSLGPLIRTVGLDFENPDTSSNLVFFGSLAYMWRIEKKPAPKE